MPLSLLKWPPQTSRPSVGCPLCAFYGIYPVDDPPRENEPLIILHVSVADPTRRIRLWLWGRATPFSEKITSSFRSLWRCAASHPFGRKVGFAPEAELGCGDAASNSAFVRRVRRPSDSMDLL